MPFKKNRPQVFQSSSPLQVSTEKKCMLDQLSEMWKNTLLLPVNASDKLSLQSHPPTARAFCLAGLITNEKHFRTKCCNLPDFHTQTGYQKNQ